MAVPKKKMSKSKTRMRRSHHALRVPTVGKCPQCGAVIQPHHACAECGHYRGRQIFKVEEEAEA